MYQIDFDNPLLIHFIGIGGISMSGLAEVLLDRGFTVSGSDAKQSELTTHLEAKGAVIYYGQRASNIKPDLDLVVYTAAIHPDNPEYVEVKKNNIPMLTRAELLGQMMKNYEYAIAVSGTHGKTTTTSMLAQILLEADTDPTISVGGILPSIGGNIRVGQSSVFVTEACEYTDSFLSFFPTMEIILNIEEDHLDYFKDITQIRNSFHQFAKMLPTDGVLVINREIDQYEQVIEGLECKVLTCGLHQESDYQAQNIVYDEFARPTYELIVKGAHMGAITLGVQGEHNVHNSLAAIALCQAMELSMESIKKGLLKFTGTNRRFEKKGELAGITIIDDYAHHPKEIEVTLEAAKKYPHKKLWCVFQPHTYTRTKAFLNEFAKALSLADEVIISDIYAAREMDNLGISSKDLVDKIEELHTSVHYFPSFDEIETFILEQCYQGDLLITMGAGDIVKVGEKLLGL